MQVMVSYIKKTVVAELNMIFLLAPLHFLYVNVVLMG